MEINTAILRELKKCHAYEVTAYNSLALPVEGNANKLQ